MSKLQVAFITAFLFLGDNFLWLVWQHFLNEGLYEMIFYLVWLPVVVLVMSGITLFVILKKEKKRSPFYFIWSFFLCFAELGVLLFYYSIDLFSGERNPVTCFIIITAAFYFAAFYELAAFIDWKNSKKPAPSLEKRLRPSRFNANHVPAAHTRTTVSGVAKVLRIWAGVMTVLMVLSSFAVLFFPASDIKRYLSFFAKLI